MKNEWKSSALRAALIVLLTVVAYIPVLRAGFVFDDTTLITDNPMVKASDGLSRFWFTTQAPDYYPLTWSLWWVEWRLWGDNPLGYHVVNILLHAVNTILVWMVLQRLKVPGAWLAGVVFALHPVNTATVAWISEQKNTLSMLFYAMAVLLYLKYDEEGQPQWYRLSVGAFLLALLSKTVVVMLPVVVLGCLWWRHGQLRRRDVLDSLPLFVLSLVLGILTVWFQHHRALVGHMAQPPGFFARLAVAGCVPWFYLDKALLPFPLTVVYAKWPVDASRWICYVPGIILIGCLSLFWWARKAWGRPLFFGLGYFVVTLFPMLGFFYQGFNRFSWVADHWQYHAIIGIIAVVVAAGEWIGRRLGGWARYWEMVVGVAVVLALGAATWARAGVYANDETLWRDNVAKNPSAWPYNLLGSALQQSGKFDEAIGQFEQALRVDPDYAEAHGNLGNTLLQAGKLEEAMEQWEQAVRLQPNYPQAHYNLGLGLARQGKVPEAMRHWEEALRIKPDYAEAHYNLGIALEQTGRTREAMEHYEQALAIRPDYTMARSRLRQLRVVP